jgi:UDP-glucuronate 4-epimerase
VIFASSSSVYGNNKKIPFAESDATDEPVSLYAATKKSCEAVAYAYHHLYGLETAGLRFFTVYGEYYRPDMAMFKFAKNILSDRPIAVYNNGEMKRDFTHVTDIVDGIKAAMFKDQLGYEIYNLGGDHPVALLELIALLEKGLGKKAIKKYLPLQPGDVVVTCADINKARAGLGFNPKTTISDGVAQFSRWFLDNQEWLLRLAEAK